MLKTEIDELQIGDWCFLNMDLENPIGEDGKPLDQYIALRFLDGDRGLAILPIFTRWGDEYDANMSAINNHGQSCWKWNGSKESPTLSPSILHWGDGKDNPASWHGFLQDGKLVPA